ncbi:MAG TPA: MerR family transcriptional regulator [Bacillota bacterium]|nr:MerR family transcriptional regulator [Bacillota bacterium]
MDIRNCKRCNKIFNSTGTSVCPECNQQEQEDFSKIRDYLFSHPNSSIMDVNLATGIDIKIISRFLKDGRGDSDGDSLSCEKCGQAIKTGRFCEKCIANLKDGFQQATGKAVAPLKNPWQGVKGNKYEHIIKKN